MNKKKANWDRINDFPSSATSHEMYVMLAEKFHLSNFPTSIAGLCNKKKESSLWTWFLFYIPSLTEQYWTRALI